MIAGDIKVSLANVELLTLQIRLLVCSIDKAEQIGLNWWRYDTNLTTRAERAEAENVELRERLSELEQEIRKTAAAGAAATSREQKNLQTIVSARRAKRKQSVVSVVRLNFERAFQKSSKRHQTLAQYARFLNTKTKGTEANGCRKSTRRY